MKTEKPIVFLFHPNECLDSTGDIITTRRSSNPIGHFFADKVRQKIKLKNLGKNAISEMEIVIKRARKKGFEFTKVSDYRKKCKVE
jgi:hypothetical protein